MKNLYQLFDTDGEHIGLYMGDNSSTTDQFDQAIEDWDQENEEWANMDLDEVLEKAGFERIFADAVYTTKL